MLFVDFTATPDDVQRRTGCRELFAGKKRSCSRSRVRKREKETKGLKERTDDRQEPPNESSLQFRVYVLGRYMHALSLTLYARHRGRREGGKREEINKHIKPRDSFTPDKNMSRDTYLDPHLLISLPR